MNGIASTVGEGSMGCDSVRPFVWETCATAVCFIVENDPYSGMNSF